MMSQLVAYAILLACVWLPVARARTENNVTIITTQPSIQLTTATSTPTASPLNAPSAAPSWSSDITVTKHFLQILKVDKGGKLFDDIEQDIYEKAVMEKYTVKFGEMVGEPFVTTVCSITGQEIASRRERSLFVFGDNVGGVEPIHRLGSEKYAIRHSEQQQQDRQLQTNDNLELVLRFTMTYTSRYGIDVSAYPVYFGDYINDNLQAVTLDMQNKFLPVAEAQRVIILVDDNPTMKPTMREPTLSPSESSLEEMVEVVSEYTQQLRVTEMFNMNQVERFCLVYNSYTLNFGHKLGEPQIYTKCTVISQLIGYAGVTRRKLTLWNMFQRMLQEETNNAEYILTMNFHMKYSTVVSVYDLDLDNYNTLFTDYVNSNTAKVLVDMQTLQLPVLNVSEVIQLEDTSPANETTMMAPQTEAPVPRSQGPSTAPSSIVSPPTINPETNQASFELGLSLGLRRAFTVAAFGFIFY